MEEALIKRILPHSIEAEQSVIGSMLLDRDAILIASEILTSDDFYQNQYGIIFDASGFPYLQVDSIVKDGSYLQVQMIVLWNEAEKNNYEKEQEQKRTAQSNITEIEDEVF